MTTAHEGSRINKNTALALPQGMFLFPYSRDAYTDTTGHISAIVQNASYVSRFPRKFTGSLHVLDGTVQRLPYDYAYCFNTWNIDSSGSSALGDIISLGDGSSMIINKASNTRVGLVVEGIPISDTPLTFSFKFKRIDGPVATTLQIQMYDANGSLLHGTGLLSGSTIGLSSVDGWQVASYTLPKFGATDWLIIYVNSCPDYALTTNSFIIKEPMLEHNDHYTEVTTDSRDIGGIVYGIGHLGMKDAGCIACWIMQSDTMINNRANSDGWGTAGTPNNQYLLKLGSKHPYSFNPAEDWYADAMTLWIQNDAARKFRYWSTGVGGASQHIESTGLVSSYGGVGTWNHYVIQWDKNGLPSGNKKEFYINGVLQGAITDANYLPQNNLVYLSVGSWDGTNLRPNTWFEQLAIHPRKGFSAAEILSWYEADAPFVQDKSPAIMNPYYV